MAVPSGFVVANTQLLRRKELAKQNIAILEQQEAVRG
jgi:hypothetical protein